MDWINTTSKTRSCLHVAAAGGHAVIVQRLLALHADANRVDLDSMLPVTYGVASGSVDVVSLLLAVTKYKKNCV